MSSNRVVILTGGSTGLGQALLTELNQYPQQTLINISRREAKLEQELAPGSQLINIPTDLHQLKSITQAQEKLTALLQEAQPTEAVFIHNAGQVTPMGLCNQLTDVAAIDAAYRLNISSVIALNASFLAALGPDTDTRVLLISSGAGRSPIPGWAVYGSTKAAMDYYAQTLQQELPHVRCVSLAPGVADTDMQATIRGHDADSFPPIERFLQMHAQQQLQSPAETAQNIVRHLFSDQFGHTLLDDIRQHS